MGDGVVAMIISGGWRQRGQASLEMTAVFAGILLLLFACFKILFWSTSRVVRRQQAYEAGRRRAGSQPLQYAKKGLIVGVNAGLPKERFVLNTTTEDQNPCLPEHQRNRLAFFDRPACKGK